MPLANGRVEIGRPSRNEVGDIGDIGDICLPLSLVSEGDIGDTPLRSVPFVSQTDYILRFHAIGLGEPDYRLARLVRRDEALGLKCAV
jgi:hypothetical protein